QFFTPMIRNEDRIFPNCFDDQCGKDSVAAARDYANTLAVVDLQFHCSFRMNLDVWLRTLLYQKTNAPRLISRQVLIDHSAARQNQRILIVGNLLWRFVSHGMKSGPTIRMIKALFK